MSLIIASNSCNEQRRYAYFIPLILANVTRASMMHVMAGEISRLVGVYPAVPESMVFAPDDESEFEALQTDFFRGIVAGLGYVGLTSVGVASIRSRELIRENDVAVAGNETNDRVTELRVLERTVASTLKIRTEFNFIQGLFALHITPDLEQHLRPQES